MMHLALLALFTFLNSSFAKSLLRGSIAARHPLPSASKRTAPSINITTVPKKSSYYGKSHCFPRLPSRPIPPVFKLSWLEARTAVVMIADAHTLFPKYSGQLPLSDRGIVSLCRRLNQALLLDRAFLVPTRASLVYQATIYHPLLRPLAGLLCLMIKKTWKADPHSFPTSRIPPTSPASPR